MSDDRGFGEFLAGFAAEGGDLVRTARDAIAGFDPASEPRSERSAARALAELLRALHTLKGLAAMVDVEPIVELAHALETATRATTDRGGAPTSEVIGHLRLGVDAIGERLEAIERGQPVSPAPTALLRRLESTAPKEAVDGDDAPRVDLPPELLERLTPLERAHLDEALEAGRRAVVVEFTPTPALASEGLGINRIREVLEERGELVRVLPVSRPASDTHPGGLSFALLLVTSDGDQALRDAVGAPISLLSIEAARPPTLDRDEMPSTPSSLRVDLPRIERAVADLSALVVTTARLERVTDAMGARGADVRELRVTVQEQRRELRALRESVLRLRLVPVEQLLDRLPLVVRGLSAKTKKPVRLTVGGAWAELDKLVAERLFGALVHLLRNAVDHGIEASAERRRVGKPEEGRIDVRVDEPRGDAVVLRISDDGAGIDRDAVARAAGSVPADDAELLALLVRPGLSTRDAVSQTSGRGVGMDVVHRTVTRELRGDLVLENRPGRGATFVVRVPVTLSVVDTLGFMVGDQPFVTPLATIDEILDRADVRVIAAPQGRATSAPRMIERRGQMVPYVDVAELLRVDAPASRILVTRNRASADRASSVAFGVQRTTGQHEVVVRPLLDPLVQVPGVTGSTDLGDGRPTLMVDLMRLREARA